MDEDPEMLWMPGNISHVGKHRTSLKVAAEVLLADDYEQVETSDDGFTFMGQGTCEGALYYIVYQVTRYEVPPKIYVVTCYKIKKRKPIRE